MAILSYFKTLAVALSVATTVYAGPSTTSVVDLGYARYQGVFNSTANITSFRGIRYAAPPTYSARWKLPQPPAKVLGLQQAKTNAKDCYDASVGAGFPISSNTTAGQDEDCLFLNVFVPGGISAQASLPVVIWLHGGGYVADAPSSAAGDGGDFVRDANGGVITVVIQYRVGIFGFLAGSEIKANGALNAGLLDQRFAMQWVQNNIASFGGDPAKVTIWGESAGAGSVLQHVVANGGKTAVPLFRAAITSSIYLPSQYHYNDSIPEALYAKLVNATNCAGSKNTLSCLRRVDASTLAAVNNQLSLRAFSGTADYVPVVDGEYIVDRPINSLKNGLVNGNALLAVTNSFEGRVFVNQSLVSSLGLPAYLADLFPNFNQTQVNATVAAYTNVGFETAYDQAVAIMGESLFICPSLFLAEAFGTRGYKCEFAVPPGLHGEDLGEYFPSIRPAPSANLTLKQSFAQSFLAVVMSLDPNAKFDSADITPAWPTWSANRTEMVFNVTETGQAVIQPVTTDQGLFTRCLFWGSVSPFTPQ